MDEATLQFRRALERQIGERTGYNKDLLAQQRDLGTEIASLPSQLREQFSTEAIRDPFAQERIIANRRGSLTSQQGFLNSLLEQRGQRFSDIIGGATEGVQAILADRARARAAGGGFDIAQFLADREERERLANEQAMTDAQAELRASGALAIDPYAARDEALKRAGLSGGRFIPQYSSGLERAADIGLTGANILTLGALRGLLPKGTASRSFREALGL